APVGIHPRDTNDLPAPVHRVDRSGTCSLAECVSQLGSRVSGTLLARLKGWKVKRSHQLVGGRPGGGGRCRRAGRRGGRDLVLGACADSEDDEQREQERGPPPSLV